jgi:phage terminase large subunit GpA-like protein
MQALAPPPTLTVSQWADEYRYLSPVASAEPGKWSTARAEYQREIMDAICDPAVERVIGMLSSQVGKTEVCLNIVGYFIDQDPTSILVLMPTLSTAESWSQDRLAPMLRDTPCLARSVNDPRTRFSGNTMLHKSFADGRGQISLAGANSAASLSMKPIRILLCDEVDRYPPSAGTEGAPISLATKRTATFWNRKVVEVSSPTNAGTSRIAESYEESDQRRHWVPCPHCGECQVLQFSQVKWDDSLQTIQEKAKTAHYHCVGCDMPWSDQERMAAVSQGEWRAGKSFNGTAGFWLNELSSPWRTAAQTVSDFLHAKNDPEKLKAFVNTSLAQTWEVEGEVPDWERLVERREGFPMGVVPHGALVLTCGIDNQDNRLEAYVWAWAPGLESWLIDHRVIVGSPAAEETWVELSAFLATEYPHADGGRPLRIHQIGLDVMGHHTATIYGHIRRLHDPRLLGLRGVDGRNRPSPVTGPSLIDMTFNGQKLKGGMKLWTVSVSVFKSDLYSRLWLTRGDGTGFPPGWVHLSESLESEPIKQLVGEKLVKIKTSKGFIRSEWQKLRDRNEALDCAVYARAALSVLGYDRKGVRFWHTFRRNPAETLEGDPLAALSIEPEIAAAALAPPPRPVRRVGRSDYLNRLGR